MGLVRGGAGASMLLLPYPSLSQAHTQFQLHLPSSNSWTSWEGYSPIWQFKDVFNKQEAIQLLPHRPWDYAMDLLPGAKLPKGRVYPLSIPFITSSGPYEYLVMPYGLAKSFLRCLPGLHERGVPGVPPPLRDRLHWWYAHLLLEPGRPSPTCNAGPTVTPSAPSLLEAG